MKSTTRLQLVSSIFTLDIDKKVYYMPVKNCDKVFTLIQAKNKFTAFMLLYCVCQNARNSKSA